MRLIHLYSFILFWRTGNGFSYQTTLRSHESVSTSTELKSSRRSFMNASALGIATIISNAQNSRAEETASEEIEVYFGCGCFWHVQHEFVEAERKILGRSDSEITSRAGYAGGKSGARDGKVCYHNAQNIADYGSLGHAEVVRLKIPAIKFPEFAEEYFKLFDEKGDRPDQFGDRGSEYRNLVGLPGGVQSEFAKQLVASSVKTGDKLDFSKGRGNDPDARALAFVMDTSDYPFFIAEKYHQFHDGFNFGENYPNKYNDLAGKLEKEHLLDVNKCPNGLLGVGVLGI